MKLYLMRHGETDWNRKGLIQGSADIPLNEYGIELAQKTKQGLMADEICFDKAFCSPYLRARKTAEILIEDMDLQLKVHEDIREMNFGSYEGIRIQELRTNPDYAEINRCFDDPVHYHPEGTAESYSQVFSRIQRFLDQEILPLEGSCQQVLVVCHGAVIRAFLSIFRNLPLEEYWTIHQPNCSINIIELSKGRFTILEENRLYYQIKQQSGRRFV